VAGVRDDPARRLELAARFYDHRPGIARYRRAELAFMRWQVKRGLLAGPHASSPGSPWWRAVNEGLLRDTCEAAELADGRPGDPSHSSVEKWLHLLAGYLAHRDLAVHELPAERFFIEVALLRVLYAHSLVAAPRLALGPLAPLGRVLGDPRVGMTRAFLSLRVLPDHYPLDDIALERFLEEENRLGRMLDYAVIAPRLQALYSFAATDIEEPRLLEFIADGAPVYAWPAEEAHVWTTSDQPPLGRALTRLTAAHPARADPAGRKRPSSSLSNNHRALGD
jgi:hypothetical protein